MEAAGLPTIPVLFTVEQDGRITDRTGEWVSYDEMVGGLRTDECLDVFVKPVADCSGRGTHRLAVDAKGFVADGEVLDRDAFMALPGAHPPGGDVPRAATSAPAPGPRRDRIVVSQHDPHRHIPARRKG